MYSFFYAAELSGLCICSFALQNYTKKMTLANKSAIFMHFCIFLWITAFVERIKV